MSKTLEDIVEAAVREICFLSDHNKVRAIVQRVADQAAAIGATNETPEPSAIGK